MLDQGGIGGGRDLGGECWFLSRTNRPGAARRLARGQRPGRALLLAPPGQTRHADVKAAGDLGRSDA